MYRNEVIDRYMYCIMQDLKKQCTDFHILFSRSKLHCVELTFFEGKLGGFFVVKVFKSSYKLTKTILIRAESTFTFKMQEVLKTSF